MPLIVYSNICGQCETALPAIAGLQLLKAAADVLDDIEDADSVESLSYKYGVPLALNTASTLIVSGRESIHPPWRQGSKRRNCGSFNTHGEFILRYCLHGATPRSIALSR